MRLKIQGPSLAPVLGFVRPPVTTSPNTMNRSSPVDHADVWLPPPVLFLICALAGTGADYLWPLPLVNRPLAWWFGGIILVIALSITGWAGMVMWQAGTHIQPHKPTLALVCHGPYRFSRNPMYVSLLLYLCAWSFLLNGLLAMLMVIPLALLLHFGVILHEERYLEQKFGEMYVHWKRQVRRWL